MRKLVTIRRVSAILPIEGADFIEVAIIDGWKSIVKKEYELKAGGLCLYFEIDSFLPLEERYEFLRNSSLRKMDDLEGFRLKTMKMKGIVSQGLAQPISAFPEIEKVMQSVADQTMSWEDLYDRDFAELLGVQKYEPYIAPENIGKIRGNFPRFIRKTDQERCQNASRQISVDNVDARYEVTLKCDGTSFTGYYVDGEDGVCSRNNDLELEDSGNKYVTMYITSGIMCAIRALGRNIAIQGELMGPSIQNNREQLGEQKLYIFDIFDIDNAVQLSPIERSEIVHKLYAAGMSHELVQHIPILHMNVTLADLGIHNMDDLLAFAEGPSINHTIREGLVFKRMDGKFSFKVISNKFLLKEKD